VDYITASTHSPYGQNLITSGVKRKGYSKLNDDMRLTGKDSIRSDSVSKFPAYQATSQYTETINQGVKKDGLVFATQSPFIRHTKWHTYIPTYQERTSWEWQEAMNKRGYDVWYKSFYYPPFASSLMNVITDRNVKQASKQRFLANNSERLKSQMIQDLSKEGGFTGVLDIGYNDLKNDIGRRSEPRID
jgi:hypothetical protein